MYTKEELRRLGYSCGVFDHMIQIKGGDTPRLDSWGVHPLHCAEESFSRAIAAHAFDPSLDDLVSEAMDAISCPPEGEKEQPLTPDGQLAFGAGYYLGLKGEKYQATPASAPATLADRRKAAGLTQAEFAAALGVSRSQVAQWERGVHVPEKYRDELEKILKGEEK